MEEESWLGKDVVEGGVSQSVLRRSDLFLRSIGDGIYPSTYRFGEHDGLPGPRRLRRSG